MANRIKFEDLRDQAQIWRNNIEQTYNTRKVSNEDLIKLISRVWGYDSRTVIKYTKALEIEGFIEREGMNWIILPKKDLVKGNDKLPRQIEALVGKIEPVSSELSDTEKKIRAVKDRLSENITIK